MKITVTCKGRAQASSGSHVALSKQEESPLLMSTTCSARSRLCHSGQRTGEYCTVTTGVQAVRLEAQAGLQAPMPTFYLYCWLLLREGVSC